MKKTNNKGFSLVELIVVVAIMAVLMVVVGPQLLRYVERARIQRDNTAISEIANAAKIAMADEEIYKNTTTETIASATGVIDLTPATPSDLVAELAEILGDEVTLESNAYSTGAHGIVVTKNGDGSVTVEGTGLVEQDGTTTLTITY